MHYSFAYSLGIHAHLLLPATNLHLYHCSTMPQVPFSAVAPAIGAMAIIGMSICHLSLSARADTLVSA
jgi:hypothetical protein